MRGDLHQSLEQSALARCCKRRDGLRRRVSTMHGSLACGCMVRWQRRCRPSLRRRRSSTTSERRFVGSRQPSSRHEQQRLTGYRFDSSLATARVHVVNASEQAPPPSCSPFDRRDLRFASHSCTAVPCPGECLPERRRPLARHGRHGSARHNRRGGGRRPRPRLPPPLYSNGGERRAINQPPWQCRRDCDNQRVHEQVLPHVFHITL